MKKLVISLVSLFVILLLAVVGGAFLIGTFIEKGFKDLKFTDQTTQVGMEATSYKRSIFSSSASSKVTMAGQDADLPMRHKFYHGPLAFTPEGLKLGMTYVTTTLDRDAMGEEAKEIIEKIYGEEEPILVHTLKTLGGMEEVEIEFTPVEYEDDEISVLFDGGSIESVSPGGSFENSKFYGEGSGEISSVYIKSKSEENDMRLRVDPSSFNFAYLPNGSIQMKGEFGKMTFKAEGIDGELEAVSFDSNYLSVAEGESLLLGSGEVLLPSFSLAMGDGPGVAMKDLKVLTNVKSASNNMVDYEVTYEIASMEEGYSEGTAFAPYSALMADGTSLSLTMSVPREVANQLAELQQNLSAVQGGEGAEEEVLAKQMEEMMASLDGILRNLTGGTAVGLSLGMGGAEKGASLKLDLEYTEDRPITSRKTIAELVKSLQVDLDAKIPKSVVEAAPALGEQLAPLVAMGTLTETADGFQGKAMLKDGALTTNGQPNPMLEQMAPMLEMPIDWDGMTSGGAPEE